jgi:hypothetical protein
MVFDASTLGSLLVALVLVPAAGGIAAAALNSANCTSHGSAQGGR